MTNAASIKAGEAWVGINARMGNLKQVLDKAASQVGSFAGSVNQFGEKIGGKFGGKIVSGLVGYFGVSMVDGALRSIADTMEQNIAADRGKFEGVGQAIGESITKGLESIPIVGSIGKMLGVGFDELLFGGNLGAEERLQRSRDDAEKLQSIYSEIASAQQAIEMKAVPQAVQQRMAVVDEILKLQQKLNEELNRQSGPNLTKDVLDANQRQAADAVAPLIERERARFSGLADTAFDEAVDSFAKLFGVIDESAAKAEQLEAQIAKVREALMAAGRDGEADEVEAALRAQFEAAKAKAAEMEAAAKAAEAERDALRESERIQSEIEDIITSIEEKNESYGKSERELLEARLMKLNATREQIDRALAAFDELAAKQDEVEVAASISTSLSAVGSFSPYAFDQFGGGSGAITDATQQTARNTKRMVELLQKQATTYGA